MIKKIINRLFFPEKERNLNSRTERAVQKEPSNSNSNISKIYQFTNKQGELETSFTNNNKIMKDTRMFNQPILEKYCLSKQYIKGSLVKSTINVDYYWWT